jgi:hypothetical protein
MLSTPAVVPQAVLIPHPADVHAVIASLLDGLGQRPCDAQIRNAKPFMSTSHRAPRVASAVARLAAEECGIPGTPSFSATGSRYQEIDKDWADAVYSVESRAELKLRAS